MIYITGAGCGELALLSVKAKHVLQNADCVLYDRLLDSTMLQLCKSSCEKIYVGKRNHEHTLPQAQIQALLIEKGKQYETVVRLKGGDPYVFGRGGEEALQLFEAGLAFEIIPGIPSAIGGCAYAGIPVTHRGISLGVRILSAHTKEDSMANLDFQAMAQSKDTLVFLMGLANLEKIKEGLLAGGMHPNTPMALISNAAHSNQHCVYATLQTILQMDCSQIVSPTIIVVGEVIKYHKELAFYDAKPLAHKTYLLAGLHMDEAMYWQFEKAGATLKMLCCGEIKECPQALKEVDIESYTHILFNSRNAIDFFFKQLFEKNLDARSLSNMQLCTIGRKTAEHLLRYGCRSDIVSDKADSEHFAQLLRSILMEHDHVLLPKAKNHNDNLVKSLMDICPIDVIELYETQVIPIELKEQAFNGILCTCSFCARQVMEVVQTWEHYENIPVYAMGKPTYNVLESYGCRHIVQLQEANRKTFIDAILKEEV